MSKIFVHPKDTQEIEEVTLRHPKDNSKCSFFFDAKNKRILELVVKNNEFYSWFTSDQLVQDGNLYSLTRTDPLFVLIPLLREKADKFQNLCDILVENEVSYEVQSLFPETVVSCIAETKSFEEDVFVKYSEERCLRWLEAKFVKLTQVATKLGFGRKLLGYQLSNCSTVDSRFTEDEVKVFAFELLSDYLSTDIADKLRTKLSIVDASELLPTAMGDKSNSSNNNKSLNTSTSSGKRSFEEDESKQYAMSKKLDSNANKKPKITRTQAQLAKVDKTGMKSISSFFGKKK